MTTRREFIKLSTIGGGLLATAAQGESLSQQRKPIVISTWNFGLAANAAAWKILSQNGRALDAVEAGAKVPEADPAETSVGYGGLPDRDGKVTLDACIMDEAGNCGSVAFLQHIVHPISVARLVMEKTPHVMLVGNGALRFALANGFKKTRLLTKESEKAWREWLKNAEYKPVVNIEKVYAPRVTPVAFYFRFGFVHNLPVAMDIKPGMVTSRIIVH